VEPRATSTSQPRKTPVTSTSLRTRPPWTTTEDGKEGLLQPSASPIVPPPPSNPSVPGSVLLLQSATVPWRAALLFPGLHSLHPVRPPVACIKGPSIEGRPPWCPGASSLRFSLAAGTAAPAPRHQHCPVLFLPQSARLAQSGLYIRQATASPYS
jgi:hypothetical protein